MIKKILIFLVIVGSFLMFSNKVIAHSRGFPILTINSVLTKPYPIEASSIKPYLGDTGDIASENYLVNQSLNFEFDASRSAEISQVLRGEEELQKVTYVWDFGDNTGDQKTDTPKKNHAYAKMGSYIMQISADFSRTSGKSFSEPLVVQTTLIHILPNKDYKLPQPVIKINKQFPNKGDLDVDLSKRVTFDASGSKYPSSKIIQYQWDFGSDKVIAGKVARFKYELPQYSATAVLRVKDENGFIAETSVQLTNIGSNEPSAFDLEDIVSPTNLIIGAQIILFAGGVLWYIRKRNKAKNKID